MRPPRIGPFYLPHRDVKSNSRVRCVAVVCLIVHTSEYCARSLLICRGIREKILEYAWDSLVDGRIIFPLRLLENLMDFDQTREVLLRYRLPRRMMNINCILES